MGGQPTNLATARLLPERPYMPGEQFSIFNSNGAEPMSHRGDFDDEFVSRHSADLPDGEGGTMRRVTASLLEILTQVAAVSKDGTHSCGGCTDDDYYTSLARRANAQGGQGRRPREHGLVRRLCRRQQRYVDLVEVYIMV